MDNIKLSQSEKDTLTNRGYELISKIGEGAYAQVYLSSYKDSPCKLACKIVDVPKSSATYVNKFLPRELTILMAIKSPYIIHIHSIFRRNLKYFIFMRYAEKGDLMDWIISNGAVPQEQSKMWGKQIVLGIQYLHKSLIAHRDIKCENILITEKNHIKLTDFGFSRYIIENDSNVSFSETYCGSLLYVAPEIVKGVAYNAFKSDIWSLGVVFFAMLNCKVPFNETNPSIIYELQMGQKYKFNKNGSLTEDVKCLIKRLLHPEPRKRPSVDDVLADDWLVIDTTPSEEVKPEQNDIQIDENSVEKLQERANNSLEDILKTSDNVSEDTIGKGIDTEKSEQETEEVQKEEKKEEDETISQVSGPSGFQIISKRNINEMYCHNHPETMLVEDEN